MRLPTPQYEPVHDQQRQRGCSMQHDEKDGIGQPAPLRVPQPPPELPAFQPRPQLSIRGPLPDPPISRAVALKAGVSVGVAVHGQQGDRCRIHAIPQRWRRHTARFGRRPARPRPRIAGSRVDVVRVGVDEKIDSLSRRRRASSSAPVSRTRVWKGISCGGSSSDSSSSGCGGSGGRGRSSSRARSYAG